MKSRAHITSSYPSSGEIQVNGKVGGASSDLYRSEDTNISVNFAPILAVPILVAGAGETSNFRRTDVELAALDIKALGFGAGLAATFTTKNAFEINLDFSAILGAEITLTFGDDGNWLLPTFSGNTYATVESSLGVGALGMGVGYSAGVRYDEGMLTASGYADFGLMSVSAGYSVDLSNGASFTERQNYLSSLGAETYTDWARSQGLPGANDYPVGLIRNGPVSVNAADYTNVYSSFSNPNSSGGGSTNRYQSVGDYYNSNYEFYGDYNSIEGYADLDGSDMGYTYIDEDGNEVIVLPPVTVTTYGFWE
ncbi:MAG: hypothetical protein CML23_03955 [Rhizobiaceae bacterium]|nr:hypothetical protein [Rhizobiaceae bacterium]|tara:strand:- start:385 stop:1311 length:927 start_codon:yes stop_codon:yes gene_type:complete